MMTMPKGYSMDQDNLGNQFPIWNPIPNQYCPPMLHQGIYPWRFQILPEHIHLMGKFIGKEGIHFKNITAISGCVYIYFIQDSSEIEIWGNYHTIQHAFYLLSNHIYQVLNKNYWLSGYDHLPMGLRPLRVHRNTNRV